MDCHANQDHHEGHDQHDGHSPEAFRQKFWLSLALTIPALVFSHTVQEWFGYQISFFGSEYISAIFGTIIFFYGGLVFLKSAKSEIKAKQPGMMTLISMAIIVAFFYSLLVTFKVVAGMDFWWELATLITVMLLGHWLEMRSVANAKGALNELAKLLPDEAELIVKNKSQMVPVEELKLGDKVRIRPGSQIPIDGKVVEGESKVNESMLTGESKPINKTAGMGVIGGTLNTNGSLVVEVTKVGDETTLAGIMKLVRDAENNKSKTQVLADRAAFYLTFISIGAAILTIIAWALIGESTSFIFERVVTVLVIACPHALGLAIPLVTSISTTMAARNGLLVRNRMALESARQVDVVVFDKTGTLTEGKQGVVEVVSDDKKRTLSLAAVLEQNSEHPIARAIYQYASAKKIESLQIEKFTNLEGRGIKGRLNSKEVYIGGPQLLKELDIQLNEKYQKASLKAAKDGKATVYVIERSEVIGAIMLADVIRQESKQAVKQLHDMGKRVALLTGDSEGVAKWVSEKLGIKEYFAEVLPGEKSDIIKKLQTDKRRVAMVGDGVNDAPALVQADIGIAIGAGTDVAVESAGIVLASNNPQGVVKIMRLSKATYSKMVQNLIWGAGYNVLALPLAAGVTYGFGFVLSPAIGAVIMSFSTIIVAINAQLLRRAKI